MRRFGIRSPLVIHETVDDEVVIVNLQTGNYYSLVGTGARIWALLESTATVSELAADIAARFDGAGEQLEETVQGFVDELEREGLIVPADVEPPGPRPRAVPVTAGGAFEAPVLEKFTDMQELVLLDPVHEVEEDKGWPHARPRG